MKCKLCNTGKFIGTLFGIPTCLVCLADHTRIEFNRRSLSINKWYIKPIIKTKPI